MRPLLLRARLATRETIRACMVGSVPGAWLKDHSPGGSAAGFEFLESNQSIRSRFEAPARLRTAPLSLRGGVSFTAGFIHRAAASGDTPKKHL